MGLVELIPDDYNTLLVVFLILHRLIHGYAAFLGCKMTVECCRAWFPDHFDLTVGLAVSAYYLGGSLAILMGGYIYDSYGYQAPYLSFGLIALIFWVYNLLCMPKNSDPLISKPKIESTGSTVAAPWSTDVHQSVNFADGEKADMTVSSRADETLSHGLSWYVSIPLVAMSLTVVLEGFSAAITVPYMNEEFDIPVGQGSSYMFVLYLGLMAGAATCGSILQLTWLSATNVMTAGSLLGVIGVILVYPGEGIPFLHELVPQLAYLGVFLQGYGSQMIGVASLSAVEEIHSVLGQRSFTNSNSSTAATLWLCAWMVAVYGGHLVALLVMEHMSYPQGGWLLAAFSGVSVAMSLVQYVTIKRFAAASKPQNLSHIARALRHTVPNYQYRHRLSFGYVQVAPALLPSREGSRLDVILETQISCSYTTQSQTVEEGLRTTIPEK